MPLTAAQFSVIAGSMRANISGKKTVIQNALECPTFAYFEKKKRTVNSAGGEDGLLRVQIDDGTQFNVQGVSGGSPVTYDDVTGKLFAAYKMGFTHIGWGVDKETLARAGIKMVSGQKPSKANRDEKNALDSLIRKNEDKLMRSRKEAFAKILFGDGTADPDYPVGLGGLILKNPSAAGTTAGLDRATYPFWRNLAYTAAEGNRLDLSSADPKDRKLFQFFRDMVRDQKIYGGMPDFIPVGRNIMSWLEREADSFGILNLRDFDKTVGIGVKGFEIDGAKIVHDPILDNLGRSSEFYSLDTDHIWLEVLKGEWNQQHNPEREPTRYMQYAATTDMWLFKADQLNCHATGEILF